MEKFISPQGEKSVNAAIQDAVRALRREAAILGVHTVDVTIRLNKDTSEARIALWKKLELTIKEGKE